MNSKLNIKEFPNGFQCIHHERADSDITAINLFVRVGSNYETKDLNGVSHFIEHMVFKGTKSFSDAKEIAQIFDEIGAYFNAYTTENVTCYVVKCSSIYIEKILNVLDEMLLHSLFRKIDFEREKNVVVEEIDRSKDNTASYIMEKIYELIFENSGLANPTGGEKKLILNYDYDDTMDYFRNFYKPSNMVISICSGLKSQKIFKMLEKLDLTTIDNKFDNVKYLVDESVKPQNNIKIKIIDRELEQTHLTIGFKTTDMYNDDRYVLEVIKNILSGNMSSRLFINLREKNGLTYSISINNSEYEYSGCFVIQTSVNKDKIITNDDPDAETDKGAIPVIIDTLNELIENGLMSDELKKTKGFIRGSLILENEDSTNVADYNGRLLTFKYPKIISIDEIYEIFDKITEKDIERVLKTYFRRECMSCYMIGRNIDKSKVLNELNRLVQ